MDRVWKGVLRFYADGTRDSFIFHMLFSTLNIKHSLIKGQGIVMVAAQEEVWGQAKRYLEVYCPNQM